MAFFTLLYLVVKFHPPTNHDLYLVVGGGGWPVVAGDGWEYFVWVLLVLLALFPLVYCSDFYPLTNRDLNLVWRVASGRIFK